MSEGPKDRLAKLIARLVDHPDVRRDLIAQAEGGNFDFAEECLYRWLEADEDTRAEIAAFHESDGPEKVRQVGLKHEDGTPTAADLEAGL